MIAYLVVEPNWIRILNKVFRKWGGLQSSLVCCHISDISILISFGFLMLSARTDLLVLRDIVLMLPRSFKLLIYNICFFFKCILIFVRKIQLQFTGYSICALPVFLWYMYLKISSASSVSPNSIRNFGLSGKKKSQHPSNKLEQNSQHPELNNVIKCNFLKYNRGTNLGIAQIATNKFQLWNKNQPSCNSTSNGIINQAIA